MFQQLKKWIKFLMPFGLLQVYQKSHTIDVTPIVNNWNPSVPCLLTEKEIFEIFPGIDSVELGIVASHIFINDFMICPLKELLVLGAICKKTLPRTVFEIGTYTGVSTSVLAINTPDHTEITTLDIDLSKTKTPNDRMSGLPDHEVGSAFKGKQYAKKIRQVYGDSSAFDFSPYRNKIDLVFIDANHTYEFVKKDTENAFSMIRKGGIIIWDDYLWNEKHPECSDVARFVNELITTWKCYLIAGTRFAIYIDDKHGCKN